jgi:hypothetical protein
MINGQSKIPKKKGSLEGLFLPLALFFHAVMLEEV